ncbi:MAG: spermidine/putrescine ABC transporter substrate-binding protein [Trueperaceae bacterium]|nr:spermidine/putrescine ABC transporter substrate-binding protein [Trueperaceae bacterium]
MRKSVLLIVLFSLLSLGLAQNWTCPEGFEGQTLNVYNWTTYIAEDTIPNFEEACGVSVQYDTFPTDDDMLAKIRQGNPGYDIVVPSSTVLVLMIEEGLVETLDKANIPNFANLDDTFLGLYFDPANDYSVPYQWGTIGIGYNIEKTGKEITTWDDVFSYDGAVSWLEDIRSMMGVALEKLGYDPNSSNPDEINAAKDYLIENGSNVVYINQDDGQEVLVRGEADIVSEYSGDIFQIMDECGCDTYRYVIPSDGANFWIDNVAIPVDAPNHALAEVFIDYLLDAKVGADISNYTAYGSPNRASIEGGFINEALLSNKGIYPSEETRSKLFFIIQDPEREQLYNDAWDEVRIFVGQ